MSKRIKSINEMFFSDIFPAFITGSVFLCFPVVSYIFGGNDGIFPIVSVALLFSLFLIYILKPVKKIIRITPTDLCFGLYVGYGIIRMGMSEKGVDPLIFCEWWGIFALYLVVRGLRREDSGILYAFLIAGGVLQGFIAMGQYVNLLPESPGEFKTTGCFFNPGPLGGYLALCFASCFAIWRKRGYAVGGKTVLYPLCLAVLSVSMILADSRAAWVAAVFSSGLSFSGKRISRIVISVLFALIFAGGIYHYRKGSADMRLLTWKASRLMIKERPVTGHGIGGFPANYMKYQASYLEKHPEGKEAECADNNLIAFNEFIRLICEQGFVGFFIFIFLLVFSFMAPGKPEYVTGARFGLAALATFACFSYPASVYSLKLCFPLFIGILGKEGKILGNIRMGKAAFAGIATVIGAGIFFHIRIAIMHSRAYDALYRETCIREETEDYSFMKHDKHFLYLQSSLYVRYGCLEKALEVKKRLSDIAPTSSLLYDMGMIYLRLDRLDSATLCFREAAGMTPNHILPVYGLWSVARIRGDTVKCRMLSEKILSMPVRVKNSAVFRARKSVREYLSGE